MRRQWFFFVVVIGAILAVLAIFGVIVLVLGDDEDQGDDTGPSPSPESSMVLTSLHPGLVSSSVRVRPQAPGQASAA